MTTEERFEHLECELAQTKSDLTASKRLLRRLLAGFGAVALLFLAGVVTMTMTGVAYGQGEEEIRSQKFVVEDKNGKARIEITVNGLQIINDNNPWLPNSNPWGR